MSGVGLVSRVTPVHTAMRNRTRDEGRSFEVGNRARTPAWRATNNRGAPGNLADVRRLRTDRV
jgi:hypothetical protein